MTDAATTHDLDTTDDAGLRTRAQESIVLLLPRVLKRELTGPIPGGAGLMEDLGLTSGGTLELILELEDHLDIQIDVEDIRPDDLRSIETLADFVAGHVVAED